MSERPRPIGFWWSPRFSVNGPYLDEAALTGTWRTFKNYRYERPRRPNTGGTFPEHAAWVDNRYKLHQLADGHFELYDLIADRAETRDLAQERPDEVKKMSAELAG